MGQPHTVGELKAMLWPISDSADLCVVNAPRAKFYFESIRGKQVVIVEIQESAGQSGRKEE